jgi:hypothetical protein
MTRLPTPGGDDGTWGSILNDFLGVEHNSDGSLRLRNDGTIPRKLTQLSDVDISAPADQQVLGFDGASGRWQSQTLPVAPTQSLASDTDVQISAPNSGQALLFSGSKWQNQSLVKASVGLANVDNTSDADKPISTLTQTALNQKSNKTEVVALAVALG